MPEEGHSDRVNDTYILTNNVKYDCPIHRFCVPHVSLASVSKYASLLDHSPPIKSVEPIDIGVVYLAAA